MTWVDWVTLALAVLGAVLGVTNAWHQLRRDRPRFHVESYFDLIGFDQARIIIKAVNTGQVAATIDEAGFYSRNRWLGTYDRYLTLNEEPLLGDSKPQHVAPGAAITLVGVPGTCEIRPEIWPARPYVKTADGRCFYGPWKWTTQIAEQLRLTGWTTDSTPEQKKRAQQ